MKEIIVVLSYLLAAISSVVLVEVDLLANWGLVIIQQICLNLLMRHVLFLL